MTGHDGGVSDAPMGPDHLERASNRSIDCQRGWGDEFHRLPCKTMDQRWQRCLSRQERIFRFRFTRAAETLAKSSGHCRWDGFGKPVKAMTRVTGSQTQSLDYDAMTPAG